MSIPMASHLETKLDVSVIIPGQRNTSCDTGWADMPADVLFTIFKLFLNMNNHDFLHLYQFFAVCHSWRFVAKQIWRNLILPTTPWLLQEKRESCEIVFNTKPYRGHKHLRLDTIDNISSFSLNFSARQLKTYASSDGWLLQGDSVHRPLLYNPVTRYLLRLPLLPLYLSLHSHMKFVLSLSTPTDPNCIICLKFSKKRDFANRNSTTLAFCRPASSQSWLEMREIVEDIVFCDGQFYAIATCGALFVYNDYIIFNATVPCTSWTWMNKGGQISGMNSHSATDAHCFLYLVESKTGDLLLIRRRFKRHGCTTKSLCIFKLNCSTKSLCIFKLNYSSDDVCGSYNNYFYWHEISSLPGKEALLLGWNDCTSISTDEHSTYRSDCIYFYDQDKEGKLKAYGMYDLRSHSITRNGKEPDIYHCRFFNPSKPSYV